MVKLGDAIKAYESFSGVVSQNVRYLSIAGFALVWLLSGNKLDAFPNDLLWPSAILVFALALDFFQYAVAAALWGHLINKEEKRLQRGGRPVEAIDVSRWINTPARALLWSKCIVMLGAYVLLLRAVMTRLQSSHP